MTHQQRVEFSIAKDLMDADSNLGLSCAIKAAGAARLLIAKYAEDAYRSGMVSSIESPKRSILDKEPATTYNVWAKKQGLD